MAENVEVEESSPEWIIAPTLPQSVAMALARTDTRTEISVAGLAALMRSIASDGHRQVSKDPEVEPEHPDECFVDHESVCPPECTIHWDPECPSDCDVNIEPPPPCPPECIDHWEPPCVFDCDTDTGPSCPPHSICVLTEVLPAEPLEDPPEEPAEDPSPPQRTDAD